MMAASGYADTSCSGKMAAGKSATPWIHHISTDLVLHSSQVPHCRDAYLESG